MTTAALPVFRDTSQQTDFYTWTRTGSGSAELVAVAGAGKTTTLVKASVEHAEGTVAIVCYNKAIATELEQRIYQHGPAAARRVSTGTFHSFGFRAWRKTADPGLKVVGKKTLTILSMPEYRCPPTMETFVSQLVSLAKQHLVPLDSPKDPFYDIVEHYGLLEKLQGDATLAEDGVILAQRVLVKSLDMCHTVIDFDDMIYAPVMKKIGMWQYDWVMVDEAQDTNPARRAMARMMLKRNGRFVAVGDPYQAIYGFTGADNDSLDKLSQEFRCQKFPLTVSFRCARSVVAFARQVSGVTHIESAETAPEGLVDDMPYDAFLKMPPDTFTGDSVMLCRVTKPLVQTAYALMRRKIGVVIEGKDIGLSLITLAKKWSLVKTVADLRTRLQDWLPGEVDRLLAKKQDSQAESLVDRADALHVILDTLADDDTVQKVIDEINGLFADTDAQPGVKRFTLSTVHKAKGREWRRVFLLGRDNFMPSRWAKQSWQQEQERNLLYVAITRAKEELIEVTL